MVRIEDVPKHPPSCAVASFASRIVTATSSLPANDLFCVPLLDNLYYCVLNVGASIRFEGAECVGGTRLLLAHIETLDRPLSP